MAAWVDAHMQKLAPHGHEAARAGGPRSPEQVAQLVAFSKRLDCLPPEIAAAVNLPETEARAIGETHLTIFGDKLACPAKPEELTALRDIATGLESYGWGPYEKRGPSCGWRGTIVRRIEETASRDTVAHPSGQPIQYKQEKNKWVEIRWEIDGDVAHVTVTGGGEGLVHNKALPPVCNGQEEKSESKFTVIAEATTVPVTIRHLREEEYLIETEMPGYTERTDTHTKTADSQGCPLKGGESNDSFSFDVREHSVLLPDTAIRIESLTVGQPSRRLDGELKTSTGLNYGKLTSVTTWDLARER